MNQIKIPPQSIELETAVIGAILLEFDAFEQVIDIIPTHEVFYAPLHQKIYACMCKLHSDGGVVDMMTVSSEMSKSNDTPKNIAYELTQICMSVTTSAHVATHAKILFEKYVRRSLIRLLGAKLTEVYDETNDVFDLADNTGDGIRDIVDGIAGGTEIHIGKTYSEILMQIEEQVSEKSGTIGVPSGYDELDTYTLGWQKTDLIILAARPSQGKTAFAVNLAVNAAVKGEPAFIFSLESSNISLVRRMAAAKNNIPLENIRKGNISEYEKEKMFNEIMHFNSLNIKIDSKKRKLSDIKNSIRKWKKSLPPDKTGVVIIDYLQLMTIAGKGSREQEIATISRDLKELASMLEIPIIALSQLNREVEKTGNKKPGLEHLRESGAIEQDANVVMFIWWEQTGEQEFKTWILVKKNRDGKCGDVQLKFNGDIQKWINYEDTFLQQVPASFVKYGYQDPSIPRVKDDDWSEF